MARLTRRLGARRRRRLHGDVGLRERERLGDAGLREALNAARAREMAIVFALLASSNMIFQRKESLCS